jgi:hypothetical protein
MTYFLNTDLCLQVLRYTRLQLLIKLQASYILITVHKELQLQLVPLWIRIMVVLIKTNQKFILLD